MSSEPSEKQKKEVRVFQLNDEKAEFEELELDPELELQEILKSNLIIYFIQASIYKSFIWIGKETSNRMKFIAAKKATVVRDTIGPAIKISTIEEDDEPIPFQVMIGTYVPEIVEEEEQTGPAFQNTIEDEILLEELSLDKIVLMLEKIGCPEGFRREMVLYGNNVYGYQEYYREYMGEILKERKLYPLEEKVPDGSYLTKGLTPRILLSYNRVVLVELLHELSAEELEKETNEQQKLRDVKSSPAVFFQKGSA
ncbi:MAG: hypothetical protein ACTSWW_01075 [Promethearchaeota archaeon]